MDRFMWLQPPWKRRLTGAGIRKLQKSPLFQLDSTKIQFHNISHFRFITLTKSNSSPRTNKTAALFLHGAGDSLMFKGPHCKAVFSLLKTDILIALEYPGFSAADGLKVKCSISNVIAHSLRFAIWLESAEGQNFMFGQNLDFAKLIIIGHSVGAVPAMYIAQTLSSTLSSSSKDDLEGSSSFAKNYAKQNQKENKNQLEKNKIIEFSTSFKFLHLVLICPITSVKNLIYTPARVSPFAILLGILWSWGTQEHIFPEMILPNIVVPICIISGDQDVISSVKSNRKLFKIIQKDSLSERKRGIKNKNCFILLRHVVHLTRFTIIIDKAKSQYGLWVQNLLNLEN